MSTVLAMCKDICTLASFHPQLSKHTWNCCKCRRTGRHTYRPRQTDRL